MQGKKGASGAGLVGRFCVAELFAMVVGAPLAAVYGGYMIGFVHVQPRDFVGVSLAALAVNLFVTVLPPFVAILRRTRAGVAALAAGSLDERGRAALFSFVSRLPLLEAGLVFGRITISAAVVLAIVGRGFDSPAPVAAAFCFAVYAGFVVSLVIFYWLHSPASRVAEAIVAASPPDSALLAGAREKRSELVVDSLPLMVPTLLSSVGVVLLILSYEEIGNPAFFAARVALALVVNLLALGPILVYGRLFHKRRLKAIRHALRDMVERGEIDRALPTDLGDDYALTAHHINRAFDLFRQAQRQLHAASDGLSGMVMSFSAQVGETVASTTQQAASVKEMVGTMEATNSIGSRILERAEGLSGNARESHELVDEGFGKVQDTIRKMDEIRAANVQTLAEIGELSEEISSIGEIIEIINGIANQTRIIAFNAELEASSAGQAGTSFRIVAEEIRRLANGTVDSLVGIKGRIGQIQLASERLLASSEDGTSKIEDGMRLSSGLNDIFTRIRGSAESTSGSADEIRHMLGEQNDAFERVFVSLKQISEGAEQVLASSRIGGAEVGRLQGLVEGLKGFLARFREEA